MTLPDRLRSRPLRRSSRRLSPEALAAARAKRARDHLARQRARDRSRLARERSRHAQPTLQRARLRVLGVISFSLAGAIGLVCAPAFLERAVLGQAPLERVAVQGARTLPAAVIANRAQPFRGQPLGAIETDRLRAAFLLEPWIERARTLRLPDGTLVVSIEERRAIGRWRPTASQPIELLDAEGSPFGGAISPAGQVPLVLGPIDSTGALPNAAREILALLRDEPRLAGQAADLVLHLPARASTEAASAPGYVLELGPGGPRVLLGRDHFDRRIARLAALLDAEAAATRTASWIDLRYADRAVLRTEPAPG